MQQIAGNPLLVGERPVRFYAGAPLLTPDGHAIGSLCVMDYEPRDPRPDQVDALRILGQQVIRTGRAAPAGLGAGDDGGGARRLE